MSQLPDLDAKVPPVVWAIGGLLAQLTLRRRRPATWARALSLLVLVAAAAFGAWGVRGFQREATTIDPHRITEVTSLVTVGAHSVSRNPMYTALLGGLVSVALWRGRAAALLPVVAVWAALSTFQVPAEEAALASAFGSEFARYRDAVPRWL
ncbi:methyltransferase family protein [Tessaracoccus antarcticus]|nr:isoprenylcysteine carboxylmethyltransferase family protein [Tessaracoccus antarcticus]